MGWTGYFPAWHHLVRWPLREHFLHSPRQWDSQCVLLLHGLQNLAPVEGAWPLANFPNFCPHYTTGCSPSRPPWCTRLPSWVGPWQDLHGILVHRLICRFSKKMYEKLVLCHLGPFTHFHASFYFLKEITVNTSLAAKGALANRLQRRTACKIQHGRHGSHNCRRGLDRCLPLGFWAF